MPAKKGAGRPSKLTPEITAEICEYIEAGVHAQTAAEAAGIAESSYYGWIRKGQAGREPYASFAKKVRKAEATCELAIVVAARQRLGDNPAWALKFLAQRFPKHWREGIDIKIDNERDEVLRLLDEIENAR